MRRPVNLPTTGKLDKDSDLQYIKSSQGDYPELVDMEFSEENVYALTTAAGNKQILDFGRVDVQDQKIRVYWGGADAKQLQLALYNTNDQLLAKGTDVVFQGDLINFKKIVQDIVKNKFPYNSLFDSTATNTDPYIDFTLFTSGSDWYLKTFGCTTAVLREAISVTGTGEYIPIGSYDLLGDVFYWLTTQRNYKSILDKKIFNAYRLQTGKTYVVIFDHGLKDGESIAINGVQGCEGVNGIWVIRYVNKDTIELLMSDFKGVYTKNQDGTTIYRNIYGYGCIGVAQQSQIWGFTPLLRSKKLNFVTKSEIYQPQIEINSGLISMYYTDNYNLPRVTYYRGPYLLDGCIKVLYPDTGQYEYPTIDQEIANQLIFSNYKLTFVDQLQSGGKLIAGNKRYAVRFISESGAPTELSLLTNPIPTYLTSYTTYNNSQNVYGSDATVYTGKINVLSLTGITPGLFKYVELICFEYIGTQTPVLSTKAIIVRRELLTATQTEITLEHNGNETGTINYDASTASQVQPRILTARDNVIIQNRLVYGNVTTGESQYDLTDFCKTLKYSIKRKSLQGQNYRKADGEFYDYRSTENSVGYQLWDWYRFYIVGEYKTGSLSQAYFAFDVRFVDLADYKNVNNNPEKNFLNPNHAEWEFKKSNITDRRDSNGDQLVNYDLGNEFNDVYQYYIELKGIDWNFIIEGIPIKDIFKSFKIFRAERKDEVLASGVLNMAAKIYEYKVKTQTSNNTYGYDIIPIGTTPLTNLWDYSYSVRNKKSCEFWKISSETTQTKVPYTSLDAKSLRRQYASFYTPDYYFLNSKIDYIPGDKMISFGQSGEWIQKETGFEQNNYGVYFYLSWFTGQTKCVNSGIYSIQENKTCSSGGSTKFDNGETYSKAEIYPHYIFSGTQQSNFDKFDPSNVIGSELGSYVLRFSNDVINNSPNTDYGLYNSLYFRRLSEKYGSTIYANNNIEYTGASVNNGISSVSVLGGDVFTQKTWIKKHLPTTKANGYISVPTNQTWKFKGGPSGFLITTQNRVNTNLRVWTSGKQVYPYIGSNPTAWQFSASFDYYEQNSGYQAVNRVQARAIYDIETADSNNKYPTRKYYSELKPNGSKIDFYRIFLPINFADNPQVFGPISRVLNVNNELFTVQARGYTREYFNSRGQLISPDSGQILIGDGSVLSRIGTNLTQFGTDHSGGVVIGKSQSGKDVVMFISPEFSQVLRFGDDGLVSVSLREFMRTFFNKNLTWAINAKTPADGNGICGIWDNRNKQFIWTIKAWKEYGTWDKAAYYGPGVYVIYGVNDQGVPYIWYPTSQIKPNEPPPSFTNPKWKAVSFTDNNFYNVYTFTWSELKAGFTQFYSFLPNHYTRWQGSVITPYPNLESPNRNKAYLHGVGNPSEFYDIQFDGGKISLVCNALRDNNKKFFALWMNASNKPERIDISSLFRNEPDGETIKKSYLLSTDFETREGYQISPVKLETDTNGSNDGDTGQMEGIWARFDITFPKGKKTNLYDMIVHIRDSFRTFTS